MVLRRLIRKIKFRPLGKLKRNVQKVLYLVISIVGMTIFFLLRCVRLIKPIEKLSKENIKKFLILRPDRIGDVILLTPVFKALKENLPSAYIAVLVDEKNKDLIISNPYINEIFTIRDKGILGLFRNRVLIKRLTEMRFDLAIILYPTLWCGLLAVICNIPHRLGYAFHGNSFLLTLRPAQKYEELRKHEVEINLDLLKLIGVETDKGELHVSVLDDAEGKIDNFLKSNNIAFQDKIIVIHPGAYEEYIRWPKEGFAKVADYLIDNYDAKVIILSGPDEEVLVNEIVSLMDKKPVIAVGLSLAETTSLIKRAKLFIGNSTGPMHIASALEVPVVAIFGSIHPSDSYKKWGPYSENNIVVHKDINCIDCQPSDCRKYKCMEAIRVEDVIEAAKRFV